MVAIQLVYWLVGRIYRKHVTLSFSTAVCRHCGHRKYSFLYFCVLERVDQIRYNTYHV
jgi:hypothetical protein